MVSWPRTIMLMPIAVLAMVMLVGAIGSACASDHRDGGPDETPQGLDFMPVRGQAIDMAIRRIVIAYKRQRYDVDIAKGVTVRDENRLPLTGVPLLRQVVEPTYTRDAFSAAKQIGMVHEGDESLIVVLEERAPFPDRIVVANQSHSLTAKAKPELASEDVPPLGAGVGKAYYHAGDQALLILIRPFVALDSGLF